MTIEFDATDPPSGRVVTPWGEVTFEGWLDLLRLLETATGSGHAGRASEKAEGGACGAAGGGSSLS